MAGSFSWVLAVLLSGVIAALMIAAVYVLGAHVVLRAHRRVGQARRWPSVVTARKLGQIVEGRTELGALPADQLRGQEIPADPKRRP